MDLFLLLRINNSIVFVYAWANGWKCVEWEENKMNALEMRAISQKTFIFICNDTICFWQTLLGHDRIVGNHHSPLYWTLEQVNWVCEKSDISHVSKHYMKSEFGNDRYLSRLMELTKLFLSCVSRNKQIRFCNRENVEKEITTNSAKWTNLGRSLFCFHLIVPKINEMNICSLCWQYNTSSQMILYCLRPNWRISI